MTTHPVFIHSLFRTGSTYLWNKFRQNDNYYCYYEPFHWVLSEITPANSRYLLTQDFVSVNHPSLDCPYLHEYTPLLEKERPGVPFFKKTFSFDEFCNNNANPSLKKYIDYLIDGAGDKIPVLQFNRSALRIKWFKKNYPGALNIYLVRNPRDQWESYFEVFRKTNDNVFFAMDILTASVNIEKKCFHPLTGQIPLIDYHDSDINNEINFYRLIERCYSPAEKYRVFYYTWLRSLLENVLEVDFWLNINRLSEDAPYGKTVEDLIEKHSHIRISLADARIKKYDQYPLASEEMSKIEESVQQSVFAALDKSKINQAAEAIKNAGDHYLAIPPLTGHTAKDTGSNSTAPPDIDGKRKQVISLLAEEYLLQGKKIQALHSRLASSETDHATQLNQLQTLQNTLQKKLQEAEQDRASKEKTIQDLEARLTRVETQHKEKDRKKQGLELKLMGQKNELETIKLSLSWRLTYPLRWLQDKLKPDHEKTDNDRKIKIAIDVTPVLPGGENGGIKLLLWELLKRFDHNPGDDKFILLTSAKNDHLFEEFKLKRICVLQTPPRGKTRFTQWLMNPMRQRFRHFGRGGPLKKNGISVLFCPFAAPTFSEVGIPTVSVIADLQHAYYPFFFSKDELRNRKNFYDQLRAKVDYIIAISDYTKNTIIEKLKFHPENVFSIPVSIQSRLPNPGPGPVQSVLSKYSLVDKKYCIYPANLWLHKNHQLLITAFAMYHKKYPAEDLHLVLTGAAVQRDKIITDSVKQMGIASRVHFTGFLTEEELSALWSQAYFLVYPSLFEGFGIPLVEAMMYQKPILTGSVTSIPEVAGDAALYFDPKKPNQIVNAIHRIMNEKDLYDQLVKKGREQLKKYNIGEMVDRYIDILHQAGENQKLRNTIDVLGVFADGWAGEKIQVFSGDNPERKIFELRGFLPGWYPADQMEIRLKKQMRMSRYRLVKGGKLHIKEPLPRKNGKLDISASKYFIPQGRDNRRLSFVVNEIAIYDEETRERLYEFKKPE